MLYCILDELEIGRKDIDRLFKMLRRYRTGAVVLGVGALVLYRLAWMHDGEIERLKREVEALKNQKGE